MCQTQANYVSCDTLGLSLIALYASCSLKHTEHSKQAQVGCSAAGLPCPSGQIIGIYLRPGKRIDCIAPRHRESADELDSVSESNIFGSFYAEVEA